MILSQQPCAVHQQAPQMPNAGMGHSQMAELTVTYAAPHRIRCASQAWLDMMGLSRIQTTGRSLGLVHGPSTDVVTINSLIKSASLGCVNSAATALYTRDGNSILMRITAMPLVEEDSEGASVCRLVMEPSDAVPVKMGLADDNGLPKVVLSAVAPHAILCTSTSFTALYGVTESQILGRTMNFMHGPLSDVRLWNSMLKNALTGQAQCASLWTCSSDCSEFIVEVTTTPAFGQDGKITHIIVNLTVPPPPDMTMEEDQTFAEQSTMYGGGDVNNGMQQQQQQQFMSQQHFQQQELQQQQQQQQNAHYELHVAHAASQQQYQMQVDFPAQQNGLSDHREDLPDNYIANARAQHAIPDTYMLHQQAPVHMEAQWKDDSYSSQPQQQMQHMGMHIGGMRMNVAQPAVETSQDDWASLALQESQMWGSGGPVDLGLAHQQGLPVSRASSSTPASPNDCMSDSSCSAIFPRRKAGQHRKDGQGPVFITLEVLESMAEVPLSDAAKQLGVSTTAMKKACRKLGVQRWPYRKHGDAGRQVELLSHYNDAYVRKLFRKYSPKVPKVKSPKSPKAESDSEVTNRSAVKKEQADVPVAPASEGAATKKVQALEPFGAGGAARCKDLVADDEQEWGSCFPELDGGWGLSAGPGELMIASGYDLANDRNAAWMQCLP